MTDLPLEQAARLIEGSMLRGVTVHSVFDEATFTATHVVSDPATRKAAIIDSVLDFDPASGRTSHESADQIIAYIAAEGLEVEWLLETHVHADHLSAAPYLRERLGGTLAIGRDILTVQSTFGAIFNEGPRFARDGSQFDRLLGDGERFQLGSLEVIALWHQPVQASKPQSSVQGERIRKCAAASGRSSRDPAK